MTNSKNIFRRGLIRVPKRLLIHCGQVAIMPLLTRVLLSVLGLLFLHIYAHIFFIAYMAGEGFFSYDFITSTEFGSGAFFFVTELAMITMSLMFFGFILSWAQYETKKRIDWPMLTFFVLMAIFSWGMIAVVALNKGITNTGFVQVGVPLTMGFFIAAYIAANIYLHSVVKIRMFLAYVMILIFMTVFYPQESTVILHLALEKFNVGGNRDFSYIKRDTASQAKEIGQLVFLSPKNAYIKIKCEDGITVIPLDGLSSYRISPKVTVPSQPKALNGRTSNCTPNS
jgi:hypothetical protein